MRDYLRDNPYQTVVDTEERHFEIARYLMEVEDSRSINIVYVEVDSEFSAEIESILSCDGKLCARFRTPDWIADCDFFIRSVYLEQSVIKREIRVSLKLVGDSGSVFSIIGVGPKTMRDIF